MLVAEKSSTQEEARLIAQNIGLIKTVLRPYSYRKDYEELFQESCLAFLTAVRRFDPDKGYKLSSFAAHVIRQHIGHIMKAERRRKRDPGQRVASLDLPLDEKDTLIELIPAKGPDTADIAEARLVWDSVFRSDVLSDREKHILRLHSSGFTFKEIGERLNLSRQRVHVLFQGALGKCRRLLRC